MFNGAENVRRKKSGGKNVIIKNACIGTTFAQAASLLSLIQQELKDKENDFEKLQRADSDALEVSNR